MFLLFSNVVFTAQTDAAFFGIVKSVPTLIRLGTLARSFGDKLLKAPGMKLSPRHPTQRSNFVPTNDAWIQQKIDVLDKKSGGLGRKGEPALA
ncbi:hypothetical protein [Mucilaginibacter ginkgonis]|uniref:Uncharacterized protein n=1 Tax=Mucilaginibacter ginkgonis TaxID=2682091 RepID=A0A6I4I1L1_9SPHI|nr:hypothetical protein [Mucilaginibacter ginkgonis]QQL50640.1 hypothetical protein GO620_004060 [Mucilaginibacter ginkgonis]